MDDTTRYLIGAVVALIVFIALFTWLNSRSEVNRFSASPNSYLVPERIPSNPLSYIIYPFQQLLRWNDVPTGATQLTTVQGTGLMTFK